jgi:peptidoglycan/LPS O-acetylase OafA/YrhL
VTERRVLFPHVRALDGVRGLAIVAVLFFHADMLKGGYLGVDLFFVLSGFLITSLLLAESSGTGRVDLLAFWARRARRLLPALFLVLLAVGLYAAFIADPSELQRIRGDALATLAYVANWRYIFSGFDYWALFSAPSPLNHTWSLAIEEQFYLVWPLVFGGVLAVRRRTRRDGREPAPIARTMLWVCAFLGVASGAFALFLWYRTGDATRIYYGTDTRAASILIGATLAALLAWRGPIRSTGGRVALEVAAVAAAGALGVAWFRLAGDRLYEGGLLVCGIAAAVVIASAAHPRPGPVARVLAIPPLVGLGLISYGLYLWHWPIYVVFNEARVGFGGWRLLGIRLAITFAIAIVSYRFVEMPCRRGALRPATLRWATPAAAALLVAVTIVSTRGYVAPMPAAAESLSDPNQASQLAAQQPGSRRLLVVGNSVAFFLAIEGFPKLDTQPKFVTLNGALPACNFPAAKTVKFTADGPSHDGIDCRGAWVRDVQAFDPDVVFFTTGDAGSIEFRHNGGWLRPCDPGYRAFHRHALDQARRWLTARGAHLVLTSSAYSVTLANDTASNMQTDCSNAATRAYAASHPGVGFIDLGRFVCPKLDTCRTSIDGAVMRPDGVHFRDRSAVSVAQWLLPQLGLVDQPQAGSSTTSTTSTAPPRA